jgi:hypothetical protein
MLSLIKGDYHHSGGCATAMAEYCVMATPGRVKRMALAEFASVRPSVDCYKS